MTLRWQPVHDGECCSVCGRVVISKHRYTRGAGHYFRIRLDNTETS